MPSATSMPLEDRGSDGFSEPARPVWQIVGARLGAEKRVCAMVTRFVTIKYLMSPSGFVIAAPSGLALCCQRIQVSLSLCVSIYPFGKQQNELTTPAQRTRRKKYQE